MEQLWAPWRLSYITKPPGPKTGDECFLCRGVAESTDRDNLIVERTPHSIVVLNRFPYNNGHLLLAPLAHKATPADLSDDETLDLQKLIAKYTAIIERCMRAEGFNIGLNLGRVAGAGLPGHLHWHIVPRWNGDRNFMPVLTDTSIISQSLDALYDLLSTEVHHG